MKRQLWNNFARSFGLSLACLSLAIPASADSFGSVVIEQISLTGGSFSAWRDEREILDGRKSLIEYGTRESGASAWEMIKNKSRKDISLGSASDFYTFSIELVESISPNRATYGVVKVKEAPKKNADIGSMGEDNAKLLAKWFGAFYSLEVVTDPIKAMAFQMGVWEIVYEDDTDKIGKTHNDRIYTDKHEAEKDGIFTVRADTGRATLNQEIHKLVDSWFDSDWEKADCAKLIALSAPVEDITGKKYQDQVTAIGKYSVVSTPSPGAMSFGLIGLLGLGLRRRRR